MGLGAFHRAHQAWYTDVVDADREWGIAAFTGRRPRAATVLQEQDGLYTLVERAPQADRLRVVSSIVRADDGNDLVSFLQAVAAETTSLITLTVTEVGYLSTAEGGLDLGARQVVEDRRQLQAAVARRSLTDTKVSSIPGRLVLALEARRRAEGGQIALVPCDNLPSNGAVLRRVVTELATEVSDELAAWIGGSVSFVNTSVDRITPRTTQVDEREVLVKSGWADRAVVVTEPFHDWVLSGDFPASRPAWELNGAKFVDDITRYENRKLWLLNGAHTILASCGIARGHSTVGAAARDPLCQKLLDAFWVEAGRHLPPELDAMAYQKALVERFGNTRIEHSLAQIAEEGLSKVRVRILPTLFNERRAGRRGDASALAIAAWLDAAASRQPRSVDSELQRLVGFSTLDRAGRVRRALEALAPELAEDAGVLAALEAYRELILSDSI
jgi:fructuronate reductase